jgi:predicted DNA-binding antitoxin AbrB/MazE fold protein
VEANMSQIVEATFDGQVFRPVEIVELQPDTKVQLVVTVKIKPEEKQKSFLKTARSLKLKGPKDFSSRIDDYLYGGAKIDDE